VLETYRRIEDWHGVPDPTYRGTGGLVYVEPAPNPNPIAPALLEGARSIGIPTFENQNGRMMEGDGGASIIDVRARDVIRQYICIAGNLLFSRRIDYSPPTNHHHH
jgi:choline dehydrogenase